jgi:hypothetical protein
MKNNMKKPHAVITAAIAALALAGTSAQGASISHSTVFGTNYTVDLTQEGSQDWETYLLGAQIYTVDNTKSGGSGIDGFNQSANLGSVNDGPIGHALSFTDGTSPTSGSTTGWQFNTGSIFPESPVTHSFTLSSQEVGQEHIFRLYFSAFRLTADFSSTLNGTTDPAIISHTNGQGDSSDGPDEKRNGMYELRWTPDNLTDQVIVNLAWIDGPSGFDRGGLAGSSLQVIPEPATYALLGGLLALSWVMVRRRR